MYQVLVVEDEPVIRVGLKTLIEQVAKGYVVKGEAEHGKSALEYLRSNIPDLVITDIRMREMDGLSLIAKIRDMYSEMPIVIISGHGDFEYAQKALKYGVIDYLLKPVDRLELIATLEKIRTHLERKSLPANHDKASPTQDLGDQDDRRLIRQVKDHIKAYPDGDLRLQTLAEIIHLNPAYLSQLFKTETGLNFSDYVSGVRIDRAKKLLRETNLKIYDIARLSGYQSPKHFMIVFKKEVGITPTAYRDEKQTEDL